MAESLYSQCGDVVDWTADAAYSAGAKKEKGDK